MSNPLIATVMFIGGIFLVACGGDEGAASSSGTSNATGGGQAGSGAIGVGAGGDMQTGGGGASSGGGSGGQQSTVPLPGFGDITGACGQIEPFELETSFMGFSFTNTVDFGNAAFSADLLSEGGQVIFNDPNAGGSSKESEAIAFDMLYRCELAGLLKTETQITYDTTGKITDLLVEIDGVKVGVSVVRAFKFMAEYTVQDALDKMTEKLLDIQESTANVAAEDAWDKQVLAVIAEKPENALRVSDALEMLDSATLGNTIVVVTVTNGEDAFIY